MTFAALLNKFAKRYKYIVVIMAVFFVMQMAFVNCVVFTSDGFQTNYSSHSKGNGAGYVGIDAPAEAKAGSSFLATAYGGTGTYSFYMIEGKATITPIVNSIVEVEVSLENTGNSISIGVKDSAGNAGSARITLLPSDPKGFATSEPTGSAVSSMLVSPDGTLVFKNNGAKSIITSADSGNVILDIENILGADVAKEMRFQKFSEDSEWLIYQNGQYQLVPWTFPTKVYLIKRDGSEVVKIIDPNNSFCQSVYPFYALHFQSRKIAYFCRAPIGAMFVMNFDGTDRIQISNEFLPLGTYNSVNSYGVGQILFSPNGEYISYSGYVNSNTTKELYIGQTDGTNFKLVNDLTLPQHRISNMRFSPDSTYLIYESDEEALTYFSLYRVNSDHSSKIRINQVTPWANHAIQYVDITNDSQRIAYIYGNPTTNKYQLYTNHRDGNQEILISRSGYNVAGEPRPLITKDGLFIVFAQQDPKSSNYLYLKSNRMTGGALKSLSFGQFTGDYATEAIQNFQLLPPNNEVVYTSKEEAPGRSQLYKISLSGLNRIKLSPSPMPAYADVRSFIITPDGSRVIYSADLNIDEQFEIYSVSSDGSNRAKLSPSISSPEGDAFDVNWVVTPDSHHVLFQADSIYNNRYEYYRSSIDGTEILKTSPEYVDAKELLNSSYYWGTFIDSINYAFLSVGHDFYGSSYRPFIYNTDTGKRFSLSPNWDDSRINYNLRIQNMPLLNKALIYADSFSGGDNLWIINKDGTAFVDLFQTPTNSNFTKPKYSCFKLSADEKYIAFAGALYSYFSHDLAVAKTDGTIYSRLTPGFNNSHDGVFRNFMDCDENFDITPDSSRVVYIADHSFWEREVWSVKIDGTDRRLISQDIQNPDSGSFSWPSDPGIRRIVGFTPDSKWVFYYGNPVTPNENHLYAVSPQGGPIYQLTEQPNSFTNWYAKGIFVSKDSSTIVYRQIVDGMNQMVASSPTGQNKRVLNGPLSSGGISLIEQLSDSDTFIYSANELPDGTRGIFRLQIDGSNLKKLSGPQDVFRFELSDTESMIIYIQKDGEEPVSRTLWEVSITGTNQIQIPTIQRPTEFIESTHYVPGTNSNKVIYVTYESSDRTYHYYLYDKTSKRNEEIWVSHDLSNRPSFYKSGFAIYYNETVQFIKFPF